MKILVGLFLLAHGLLHASYLSPKPNDPNYPFSFEKGWLAQRASNYAKPLGVLLVIVTIVSYTIAGIGVWGIADIPAVVSQNATVIGSASSLLLLLTFWHPWLILGLLIDIVLIYGVVILDWTLKI